MGFSYRKGFKMGPVRLNLSGSGIGASVGVKGFRVGTSARGRSYLRAGRGGLLYQASLGGASRSQAPVSQLAQIGASSPAPASGGSGCLIAFFLFLCAGFGFAFLASLRQEPPVPEARMVNGVAFAIMVGIAALIVALKIRTNRRRRAVSQYLEAAMALAQSPQPTSAQAGEVLALRAEIRTTLLPTSTEADFEAAYRTAVADVVADQQVTIEERRKLELIARGLSLPAEVVERANLNGFMQGFSALVADGRLDEEEEGKLEELRKAFHVPRSAVKAQLARADELRRARLIGENELTAVSIGVKLKKTEECCHETSVTEKKSKVARTYVEDGVRYTERELEPVRSGSLYVTNQRLLLVAEGTTNIKIDSILDLSIVNDGEIVVSVTVDGRKTPYLFAVPEPYVTLAYIEHARALSA